MADSLARARLARSAKQLNRSSGSNLPALVFLTDDARPADPLAAICALPRGSLVILRSRDPARRLALARALPGLARRRGLKWIVADDVALATELGADGAHFPERKVTSAAHWRARRPQWLVTCAAHSLGACVRATRAGADAVLLAPVFESASHPCHPSLGALRARLIANLVRVPVYALGGIDTESAKRLAGARFVGLAAIGGLLDDRHYR